ncbi:MAG: redox-sensing transcriptional repressor Rex [Oscillospiraceae bacterium]|nr:redox-sensing transcriptional repressor Rex [Oscillospiraceae bacterium]
METNKISSALLGRLPRYLAHLKTLTDEDRRYVSSASVADALGLGKVLVRKDFAKVSDGGHPKTGYLRRELIVDMESFLGYHTITEAVVVGTGKLGSALLDYSGFQEYGLSVVAGFDATHEHRQTDAGKTIYPVEELDSFCREKGICMGILTVPAGIAQLVCNRMVESGIRAIWNFAPTHLDVPAGVHVHNENLAASLTELRMQLKLMELQGEHYERI